MLNKHKKTCRQRQAGQTMERKILFHSTIHCTIPLFRHSHSTGHDHQFQCWETNLIFMLFVLMQNCTTLTWVRRSESMSNQFCIIIPMPYQNEWNYQENKMGHLSSTKRGKYKGKFVPFHHSAIPLFHDSTIPQRAHRLARKAKSCKFGIYWPFSLSVVTAHDFWKCR